MNAHLLASDPNRRPPRNGDTRPTCSSCDATARRCDTARWLRSAPCCAACDHTPKETHS